MRSFALGACTRNLNGAVRELHNGKVSPMPTAACVQAPALRSLTSGIWPVASGGERGGSAHFGQRVGNGRQNQEDVFFQRSPE